MRAVHQAELDAEPVKWRAARCGLLGRRLVSILVVAGISMTIGTPACLARDLDRPAKAGSPSSADKAIQVRTGHPNSPEVTGNAVSPVARMFSSQKVRSFTTDLNSIAPITMVAPFWEKGWFWSLCIVSLLMLVIGFYKLRVDNLLKQVGTLETTVSNTKAELTLAATLASEAQEALREQALRDSLTGLWNRRAIFAMLEREVSRARRDRKSITLVMIDLDHFKKINDSYGHRTGDKVLREAAVRLLDEMRPYDLAGRYGGEEFLIVMPSCSLNNGVQRAEDFRLAIAERTFWTTAGHLHVTCSIGVAAMDATMPLEDLIHQADEALYCAKRLGRNRVHVGTEGEADVERGELPVGIGESNGHWPVTC
jgi:diguanylate cyclase (GGDEF)-like protein